MRFDYYNAKLYFFQNIPQKICSKLFVIHTPRTETSFNWAICRVTSIHMLIGHYNTQVAQLSASHISSLTHARVLFSMEHRYHIHLLLCSSFFLSLPYITP